MHIWAQLHYPLWLTKLGDHWIIAIKDTNKNVLHNEEGLFVVFSNEQEAQEAYEMVKAWRKEVPYLNKIIVT